MWSELQVQVQVWSQMNPAASRTPTTFFWICSPVLTLRTCVPFGLFGVSLSRQGSRIQRAGPTPTPVQGQSHLLVRAMALPEAPVQYSSHKTKQHPMEFPMRLQISIVPPPSAFNDLTRAARRSPSLSGPPSRRAVRSGVRL